MSSGAPFDVGATVTGGVPPLTVEAEFAGTRLGALTVGTSSASDWHGSVRAPSLAVTTSGSVLVRVIDATGAIATAATPLTVNADTQAPTITSGFPADLRIESFFNTFTTTASDDGWVSLAVDLDGQVLASTEDDRTPVLYPRFTIPAARLGQTATLRAVATDSAGHTATVTRQYVIQPDGQPPQVTYLAVSPAAPVEGSLVTITASGMDPDYDFARLELFANGVSVGFTSSTYLSATYSVPAGTAGTAITITAVATDARGHTGQRVTSFTAGANHAPTVTLSGPTGPLLYGETVTLAGWANDNDTNLATLVTSIDGQPVDTTGGPASTSYLSVNKTYTVPTSGPSTTTLTLLATDGAGATALATRTLDIVQNQAPQVVITAVPEMRGGATYYIGVQVSDERTLPSVQLRINGQLMYSVSLPAAYNYTWSYTAPASGTVLIEATAQDNLGLTSTATRTVPVVTPSTVSVIGASDTTWENQNLVVSGHTLTVDGTHTFASLTVTDAGVVTQSPQSTAGLASLNLTVTNAVTVTGDSRLDLSEKGYLGGWQGLNADARGRTYSNGFGPAGTSGSHGGFGAFSAPATAASALYDDQSSVYYPGGGGAGDATDQSQRGGNGGGIMRLTAATLHLDGVIAANGGAGLHPGAGGGLSLDIGTLDGAGRVEAQGGQNAQLTEGGGGGRIFLVYTTNNGFDLTHLDARGGAPLGGAGTAFVKQRTASAPNLTYDNGGHASQTPSTLSSYTYATVRIGGSASVKGTYFYATSLENVGGTLVTDGYLYYSGSVLDLRGGTTTLSGLSASSLTSLSLSGALLDVTGNTTLGSLTSLAVTGSTLRIRSTLSTSALSTVQLTASTVEVVTWNTLQATLLTLDAGSRLALLTSSRSSTSPLTITAGTVTVSADSVIDVTAAGQPGGLRDYYYYSTTAGGTAAGAAGSYGGPGAGALASAVTGDFTNPASAGYGGSADPVSRAPGGNGGGQLTVNATMLVLNGALLANGDTGWRGGSGGTVSVTAGSLSGTGRIEARGAAFGGGGGRIAVRYGANNGFDLLGGLDASRLTDGGGPGTAFSLATGSTWGALVIDGRAVSTAATFPATFIPNTANSQLTLDTLRVLGGAQVTTNNTTTVQTTTDVDGGSSFTSPNLVLP